MTGFNHGLAGAFIAVTVKQPALAITLSAVSHYLTDMLPHFSFKQNEVFGKNFNLFLESDFVFSILMMICAVSLFPAQTTLIIACMIAAAAPDLVWWYYRKSVKLWPKGLDWFTAWHYKINNRVHRDYFYFDIVWFVLLWAAIISVRATR